MMNAESEGDRAPGFRAPAVPVPVPVQLQALVLQDDIAGMPLGQVEGLLRRAVEAAHVNATAAEIRAEAERRWLDGKLEETPVPENWSGSMAELIETRPEDRADLVVDVAPDGIVEGVRPAEMTPDRGPDVGETHHTVSDETRFSGGGTWSEGEQPMSRLVPQDVAFQKRQFKPAPELANVAETLIGRHGFLEQLEACELEFKWQRLGTNSQGKRSIGAMKRVSGVWADYCSAQFVVYLAADTARLAKFTDRQVEAALFHQLLHIGKDKKGNWIRVGHDFEGFGTEVRHYGPWTEDLKIGGQAFTAAHQMGLFDQAAAYDDEEDDEDLEDDGSGVLIHADGTPLTGDEIEAMERHELDDAPAEDDDDQPKAEPRGPRTYIHGPSTDPNRRDALDMG